MYDDIVEFNNTYDGKRNIRNFIDMNPTMADNVHIIDNMISSNLYGDWMKEWVYEPFRHEDIYILLEERVVRNTIVKEIAFYNPYDDKINITHITI